MPIINTVAVGISTPPRMHVESGEWQFHMYFLYPVISYSKKLVLVVVAGIVDGGIIQTNIVDGRNPVLVGIDKNQYLAQKTSEMKRDQWVEHWGCRVLIPNGKLPEATVSGQTPALVNGRGTVILHSW